MNLFRSVFISNYVRTMYSVALNCAKKIDDISGNQLSDENFANIVFEYILFFLHLIDRFSAKLISFEDRRNLLRKLLDKSLLFGIRLFYKEANNQQIALVRIEKLQQFDENQNFYSFFKNLTHSKGESIKGTLYWEFSKKIMNIINPSYKIVMLIYAMLIECLITLDIENTIKKMV